jgi:hypothetical protein
MVNGGRTTEAPPAALVRNLHERHQQLSMLETQFVDDDVGYCANLRLS